MTDRLEITWATGAACVLVDSVLVRYPRSRQVKKGGRMVTRDLPTLEYTVAGVRPATDAEVKRWRAQA